MKILVDKDIPYIYRLFSRFGKIKRLDGRDICSSHLREVDVLFIRSVTKINTTLLKDTSVKFIGTATSGIDHVNVNLLSYLGIGFANSLGCNSISVVEYVFAVLFYLAYRDGFSLRDKVVGIVGVGNIGSMLNKRLKACGVNTLLCDPPLEHSGIPGDWVSLDKIVSEADILSFHTPLILFGSYATWHQVDDNFLDALPSGRILINTSRGSVVDNKALLKVLRSGKKLRVVLDVWEFEPNILIPLLDYVDVATPHIAGYSIESKIRSVVQLFNAFSDFFSLGQKEQTFFLTSSLFIKKTRFFGELDDIALYRLSKIVYDVLIDDRSMRTLVSSPYKFDLLRRYNIFRREWSSLYVVLDVYNVSTFKKLSMLGFNVGC